MEQDHKKALSEGVRCRVGMLTIVGGQYYPAVLTDNEVIFGVRNAAAMMPPRREQPPTWGVRLCQEVYYRGGHDHVLRVKERVDRELSLRHVRAVFHSFDVPHVGRVRACAELYETWFEEPTEEEWNRIIRKD